ncbi:hypothetical protein IFM89_027943 [Coptis chinensis]|uniref:Uncharacterized protein n=1 Tax=Coptis chinensis TaxID=261450 RepID=A0A835IF45_9MAGN|nr:hypothetical protein IFM89_027943 [Coptis chinensis]
MPNSLSLSLSLGFVLSHGETPQHGIKSISFGPGYCKRDSTLDWNCKKIAERSLIQSHSLRLYEDLFLWSNKARLGFVICEENCVGLFAFLLICILFWGQYTRIASFGTAKLDGHQIRCAYLSNGSAIVILTGMETQFIIATVLIFCLVFSPVFPCNATRFGQRDLNSVLGFVDSGRDLILAVDGSAPSWLEIALECGVDFDEDSWKNRSSLYYSKGLVLKVLHASPSAYSANPESKLSSPPSLTGSITSLVSGVSGTLLPDLLDLDVELNVQIPVQFLEVVHTTSFATLDLCLLKLRTNFFHYYSSTRSHRLHTPVSVEGIEASPEFGSNGKAFICRSPFSLSSSRVSYSMYLGPSYAFRYYNCMLLVLVQPSLLHSLALQLDYSLNAVSEGTKFVLKFTSV